MKCKPITEAYMKLRENSKKFNMNALFLPYEYYFLSKKLSTLLSLQNFLRDFSLPKIYPEEDGGICPSDGKHVLM